jgi:hypothetical protein
MKKNVTILFVFLILITPYIIFSETPEEYKVYDSDLNFGRADQYLKEIENALKDFRDLTELVLTDKVLNELEAKGVADIKIEKKNLHEISNIDWAMQNIGFHNRIVVLRGTLYKLYSLTKKIEYDLAKINCDMSESDIKKLKDAADDAIKKYQDFLSTVTYAD